MSTSSPNVNTVTLVGQLASDPVLRGMSDGRNVCDLRLAVNDQRDQPPLFIDVATFGPGADACAEYLTRGRAVGVTGPSGLSGVGEGRRQTLKAPGSGSRQLRRETRRRSGHRR
jgi:Single-strand binding protein family